MRRGGRTNGEGVEKRKKVESIGKSFLCSRTFSSKVFSFSLTHLWKEAADGPSRIPLRRGEEG